MHEAVSRAGSRPRAAEGGGVRGSARGSGGGASESFIFPFDRLSSKIHALVFIRYRHASLAATVALYAAAMLASGKTLGVSSNYFVIVPVVVAALGFGTAGGLISGLLGLPANLLMYAILGHPEYSPASKIIAEASGLVVGFVFGRLADYFRDVEREIKKRMATEEALRGSLEAQELLLRELHHRVKNNLNIIKSLVQLQRNRSRDPAFLEAADELVGRIFAISLVHDQLDKDQTLASIETRRYVEALVANISSGLGLGPTSIALSVETGDAELLVDQATSLGLILNEALTNSLKHSSARRDESGPQVRLSLAIEDGDYCLEIRNDAAEVEAGAGAPRPGGKGLGLRLVQALARNLGGDASFRIVPGEGRPAEALFDLVFPVNASRLEDL
jgi:two-component sensor histidine kinase